MNPQFWLENSPRSAGPGLRELRETSDGVVVVPREHALKVAEIARDIAKGDKAGRRRPHEKMKMPADETVKERGAACPGSRPACGAR